MTRASTELVSGGLVEGEKAGLEEKVRELEAQNRDLLGQALADPLTGLLNHRASHERLDVELQRARRERYPIAVVVLDLDFFKGLNDSWSHEIGDRVLRGLAWRLVAHLRPGDICGRLGGDEFVIGLVKANAEEGEAVVERLHAELARLQVDAVHLPLTMNAGMAVFPSTGPRSPSSSHLRTELSTTRRRREEVAAWSTRLT